MTPARWKQISSLYQATLEHQAAERETFLAKACGGDEELLREVEDLLVHHDNANNFMNAPALDVAARDLAQTRGCRWVGRHIGPYEILSLLGAGGMGEVYLARDTRGDYQVWKMPAGGGEFTQLTRTGGTNPMPSWDGESVYYLKNTRPLLGRDADLWSIPARGGDERQVLGPVLRGNFAVLERAILLHLTREPGRPSDHAL